MVWGSFVYKMSDCGVETELTTRGKTQAHVYVETRGLSSDNQNSGKQQEAQWSIIGFACCEREDIWRAARD